MKAIAKREKIYTLRNDILTGTRNGFRLSKYQPMEKSLGLHSCVVCGYFKKHLFFESYGSFSSPSLYLSRSLDTLVNTSN